MMQTMTDIHQHFLWGIDDGASTPEIMYAMLRTAYEQGIRTAVATPHAAPGFRPFDLALFRERLAEAQNFCKSEALNIRVLPGAEIAWTCQTAMALRQGTIVPLQRLVKKGDVVLFTTASGRYVVHRIWKMKEKQVRSPRLIIMD